MCSFIPHHFHNSFGTPVSLHTQNVNKTAFIVSYSTIMTKLQFICIKAEPVNVMMTSFNENDM